MFMRMTLQPARPELVGVADDVLRVRRAFEAVDDERGGALGAHRGGLPVALAEDLGGDLRAARGGNLDKLGDGRGQMILAREEVAGDGLQVAVGEPAARVKRRKLRGPGALRLPEPLIRCCLADACG